MGCDIHGMFQIKQPTYTEEGEQFVWCWLPTSWPGDRNYRLFAALANVRNGTWGTIEPLDEPRGLPPDMTHDGTFTAVVQKTWFVEDVQTADENHYDKFQVWLGDHSHSWATLEELLAFNWEQTFEGIGYVHPGTPRDEKGRPTSYAAWSSTGTQETWKETLSDDCRDFVLTIKYLKERFPSSEIRFVFGFDS